MSPSAPQPSIERAFYREHFHQQTLIICARVLGAQELESLRAVLEDLAHNGTRVILAAEEFETNRLPSPLDAREPTLPGQIWTALQTHPAVAVQVSASTLTQSVCDLINRVGCDKLVWIEAAGGLKTSQGRALSFVNLDELRALLAHPHALGDSRGPEFLRTVEMLLATGVGSINVCRADQVDDELFSYIGAGTLFTQSRYTTIRPLQLADFESATRLIHVGIQAGQLGPQRLEQLDMILSSAFGAFVGSKHLAGMVALLRLPNAQHAELGCLTTVTRFVGQGVAQPLVAFTLRHARHLGLDTVFACTTSDRAGRFFERAGFLSATPDMLGTSRWQNYDPDRKAQLRCFRCDL